MKEKSSKKESIKKDREKEEDASSLVSAEPQNALSRPGLGVAQNRKMGIAQFKKRLYLCSAFGKAPEGAGESG